MRPTPQCLTALLLVLLWPCGDGPSSSQTLTWGPLSPEAEIGSTLPAFGERSVAASEADSRAVEEMLRGSNGRVEQWTEAPELVVLTSVMQFQAGESAEYVATADVLSPEEVAGLVTELTTALDLLTGHAFEHFAGIRTESVVPGTSTRIIRKHQIVVGRYRNVRHLAGILGLGGRSVRGDGVITGAAVILDEEYDRTGGMRALLRSHELGHALGYHHVESRKSIMNPRIGPDATDLDRRIATIAYQGSGYPR
jgi:hypothetical protein